MMSDIANPKTPMRRSVHRSKLTPSTSVFMTPSKSVQPERSRQMQGFSPSVHRLRTPLRKGSTPYMTPNATPSNDEDRFIPSRRAINIELCRKALLTVDRKRPRKEETDSPTQQAQPSETPLQKEFKRRMLSALSNIPLDRLNENAEPTSFLKFGGEKFDIENTKSVNPFELDTLRAMKVGDVDEDASKRLAVVNKALRKVCGAPSRILDAPGIVDDYYLHLISWSKDNILAVALAQSVYLWNASTGDIQHLVTVRDAHDYITSVSWCSTPGQTRYVAVGTNNHAVHVFDCQALRKVRTLLGHRGRVASIAWNHEQLSSGGRDSVIYNHDLRAAESIVSSYVGHKQEVCGLKWNEEGRQLASGGNENYLCVWDAAMSGASAFNQRPAHRPRLLLNQHKAAVKALDWCPFRRGLLASGGGTADRSIKFWNTASGALLNTVDTGSQVCSLVWSKHQREICSAHGYSRYQLTLWKYPSMQKIKELKGHTARVLNVEMSPDGASVVSAGADETLRFWNIFGNPTNRGRQGDISLSGELSFGAPVIR